jgi:hypothetical protein
MLQKESRKTQATLSEPFPRKPSALLGIGAIASSAKIRRRIKRSTQLLMRISADRP